MKSHRPAVLVAALASVLALPASAAAWAPQPVPEDELLNPCTGERVVFQTQSVYTGPSGSNENMQRLSELSFIFGDGIGQTTGSKYKVQLKSTHTSMTIFTADRASYHVESLFLVTRLAETAGTPDDDFMFRRSDYYTYSLPYPTDTNVTLLRSEASTTCM